MLPFEHFLRTGGCASWSVALLVGVACTSSCSTDGQQQTENAIAATAAPARVVSHDPLTTIHEADTPACNECRITLRAVGQFGHIDDPVLLRNLPIVERDSRGLFYATVPGATDHELIVYDSAGKVLRTVGRWGSGPGEFRRIWDVVVGPADSVFIGHDNGVTVFDANGALIRSVRFTAPVRMAKLVAPVEGGFLLSADRSLGALRARSADTVGHSLYLYNADAQLVRSFGVLSIAEQAARKRGLGMSGPVYRRASWSADGTVWLLDEGGYRLENVDLTGRVRRVIGVRPPADWNLAFYMSVDEFEARAPARPTTISRGSNFVRPGDSIPSARRLTAKPSTYVLDAGMLSPDLLVVLTRIASSNWEDVVIRYDTTVIEEGRPRMLPGHEQAKHDTMIDIIDVGTGSLLARTRVAGTAFLSSNATLYFPTVDDMGIVAVRAYEITLHGLP